MQLLVHGFSLYEFLKGKEYILPVLEFLAGNLARGWYTLNTCWIELRQKFRRQGRRSGTVSGSFLSKRRWCSPGGFWNKPSTEERFQGILILPLCECLHGLQTIPDAVVGPLLTVLDIPLPHCSVHLTLPVLNQSVGFVWLGMESGLCLSVSVSVLSIWETLRHLVVSVGWKELGVWGFTCSCPVFLSDFRNGGSSPRKGFRIISLEFLRNRLLSLPVFSEVVRLEVGGEGGKMNLRYYSHLFTLSDSSRIFFISLYFLCCEAWWNVKVVSQSCHDLQERIDVGTEYTNTPTYTPVCGYANSTERVKLYIFYPYYFSFCFLKTVIFSYVHT